LIAAGILDAMATDTEPAVELLDGAASRDAGLVEELTGLINDVYATAERGLWRDGATRTTTTAASTTPIRIWRRSSPHRATSRSTRNHWGYHVGGDRRRRHRRRRRRRPPMTGTVAAIT
jgi:hypothetical protein